jgi:hypothetical protein
MAVKQLFLQPLISMSNGKKAASIVFFVPMSRLPRSGNTFATIQFTPAWYAILMIGHTKVCSNVRRRLCALIAGRLWQTPFIESPSHRDGLQLYAPPLHALFSPL